MNGNWILCLLIMVQGLTAQNLIPNPGFEDVNICERYKEQCSPKAWRNVILKGFRFPEVAMLSASREGLKPKEGLRAAIIPLFHKTRKEDRIFIQVPFLCGLEKDKEYELSFYFLLTEETPQELGIILSDSLIIHEGVKITKFIGMERDMRVPLRELGQYREWVRYSTIFKAKGGEQGLILGNFMADHEVELKALTRLKKQNHYPKRTIIWLDDFSLTAKDSLEQPCNIERNLVEIYKDSVRHYIDKVPMDRDIQRKFQEQGQHVHTEEMVHTEVGIVPEEPIDIPKPAPKPSLVENEIVANSKFVLRNINFESNSSVLLPSSFEPLNGLVDYLKAHPDTRLSIIGHTDNVGGDATNMRLSRRRAERVANYLASKGIPFQRLSSLGRGETQPMDTNDTTDGRARNRRVEFELY